MKRTISWTKRVAIAAALLGPVGAVAGAPSLLDSLRPGSWTLHEPGRPAAGKAMCVAEGRALSFVAHRAQGCRQLHSRQPRPEVVEVNYVCPGVQGMTRIRRESATLVHIDTQGIAGGAPFHRSVEARWTGECR